MTRPVTYLFPAILAGILAFLALPGSAWAAAEPVFFPVSSIIRRDFQRELDARGADARLWLVEAEQVEDLAFSAAPCHNPNPPGSDRDLNLQSGLVTMLADPAWELAEYERIHGESHDLYRLAESRVPAAVVPVAPIPERGSSLTSHLQTLAGGPVATFGSRVDFSYGGPRVRPGNGGAIRFADAAVNPARRDYYSMRNGYCDRAWIGSLSKSRPARDR